MFSSFVLAALAAAQSAAPSSSGVKWVPVDEARRAEAPKARTVPQPVIQAVPATPQYVMQAAPIAPISAPATDERGSANRHRGPPATFGGAHDEGQEAARREPFPFGILRARDGTGRQCHSRRQPGVGEITDVRNKGMWGKSGHLAARLLYVTVTAARSVFPEASTIRALRAASAPLPSPQSYSCRPGSS